MALPDSSSEDDGEPDFDFDFFGDSRDFKVAESEVKVVEVNLG